MPPKIILNTTKKKRSAADAQLPVLDLEPPASQSSTQGPTLGTGKAAHASVSLPSQPAVAKVGQGKTAAVAVSVVAPAPVAVPAPSPTPIPVPATAPATALPDPIEELRLLFEGLTISDPLLPFPPSQLPVHQFSDPAQVSFFIPDLGSAPALAQQGVRPMPLGHLRYGDAVTDFQQWVYDQYWSRAYQQLLEHTKRWILERERERVWEGDMDWVMEEEDWFLTDVEMVAMDPRR